MRAVYGPVSIWLLGVAACAPPEPDYALVRARCAEEIASWEPTATTSEVIASISDECASTLGESVGLDWESFGFSAQDLEASPTGAYVLAGLFTLAASTGVGTVTEMQGEDGIPSIAAAELERILSARGWEPSVAGSEAWYAALRDSFVKTTYAPTLDGGAAGLYLADEATVYFSPALTTGSLPPAWSASVLLHEAAHRFAPSHGQCTIGEQVMACDPDPEGAYGVEIWWLTHWQLRHPDTLVDPSCGDVDDHKRGACVAAIEASEGWPPCERVCVEEAR